MIRFIALFCLFGYRIPCGSCTECWNCENANSYKQCLSFGHVTKCGYNEICSTEVRRVYNKIAIWKRCKQKKACENQRLQQNWNKTPHTCNNDRDVSHCWCCCDNDSCNVKETCKVTSMGCPMPSLHMDHGYVTCSNTNRLGSLCSYRCNETGYHDMPFNKQERLCLGSGKWSEKKPCCVKACPPYVPLDMVALLQFNNEENLIKRSAGSGSTFGNLIHSEEYFQVYDVLFNENVYQVIAPQVVNRKFQYSQSVNNTVNTGAALRYVRNNILSHFHRSKGHSNVIAVSVEQNSNDDVTEAAAKLKEDGVMIYYIFHQSAKYRVNMEEARAVASSEKHIVVVNGSEKENYRRIFDEIIILACNYPCQKDEEK